MKLLRNTSFLTLLASIVAYGMAKWFGDPQWVQNPSMSVVYPWLLLVKTSFLSLLKMLIAPLIFFSLLGGIFSIGDIVNLKKMGKVAITYYLGTTIIAICIGLVVVFFIHPWENSGLRISMDNLKDNSSIQYIAPQKLIDSNSDSMAVVVSNFLSKAFVNPFEALSQNNIIGIVVASLLLGLSALYALKPDSQLAKITQEVNEMLHQFLRVLIRFLPVGVFAIVFDLSLRVTSELFTQLLSFCLVVFGATMIHGLVVLPLIAKYFAKIPIGELFKKIAKPLITALSTSSSSATLPISMETAERELGVSKAVSGFVFPLGATMNMDGTALFEGIAAVFLAYLFGIDLGVVGMLSVFFMAMISSIGAPGMPSGSMSGMQMVLLAAGIPLEAIGILLVVERPLDTFRTAVNVEGDIIGSLVVQKHLEKASL